MRSWDVNQAQNRSIRSLAYKTIEPDVLVTDRCVETVEAVSAVQPSTSVRASIYQQNGLRLSKYQRTYEGLIIKMGNNAVDVAPSSPPWFVLQPKFRLCASRGSCGERTCSPTDFTCSKLLRRLLSNASRTKAAARTQAPWAFIRPAKLSRWRPRHKTKIPASKNRATPR